MAITINDQPDQYTPAFSPVPFVVTSTNTAQANFKYIADIYVSGVSGFIRVEKAPHPTTGRALFDISRELSRYVASDIDKTLYGFQQCDNSYVAYEVKFGEQYGASGSITNYTSLTVTGTKYAWNGVLDFADFIGYSQISYVVGSSSARFLTNAPETQYVRSTGNRFLHMMSSQAGAIYKMQIYTFDSSGTQIDNFEISNNFQAIAQNDYRFNRFGVGPLQLNQITGGFFLVGAQPIITASVASYVVNIATSGGVGMSNSITYNITNPCATFTPQTLHWRNKLGGFDSFDFNLRNDWPTDIERASFRRIYATYSTGTWSYAPGSIGEADYSIRARDRIILTSDFLSDAQALWLQQDLLESGEVYIDESAGLFAVKPMASGYSRHQSASGELFVLTVELQRSYQRYANI